MSAGDETPETIHSPPTAPTPPSAPVAAPEPAAAVAAPEPAAPTPPSAPVAATEPAALVAATEPAASGAATEPAAPVAAAEPAAPMAPTPQAAEAPGQQAAEANAAPPGPKMVRRVVCSYQLGWLPGDWLQTWRRLDRMFARAELNVKATLSPLEDLPADTDILVVPPDLREAAREAALPGTPILVTPASAAAGAFADLISRLEAGTEFTAERLDPADKDKPKIVSYRGHTRLD